jgi:magnesium transporter
MNTEQIIIENFIVDHPLDAARILGQLEIEETAGFLKEIPGSMAADILEQFESYIAVKCLEKMDAEGSAAIVEKLPVQVATVFLRQVNGDLREEVLNNLSPQISVLLRRILSYAEDSAAALANPLIFSLPENMSVKEALQRVQKHAENVIYYLYIVDRNQVLTGVITLRELMIARPGAGLSEVMNPKISYLPADLNYQAIIIHSGWQKYHAMPVVGDAGVLLGVIDYDQLRYIENMIKKTALPREAIAASKALGELYRIGFSGLVRSATTPFRDRSVETEGE